MKIEPFEFKDDGIQYRATPVEGEKWNEVVVHVEPVGQPMKAALSSDGILHFWCPGCDCPHGVGAKKWGWNGSLDSPTLSPSVLVRHTLYGPNRLPFSKYNGPHPCEWSEGICHCYITAGRIRFLNDCTHALAGQELDLPPWTGEER